MRVYACCVYALPSHPRRRKHGILGRSRLVKPSARKEDDLNFVMLKNKRSKLFKLRR